MSPLRRLRSAAPLLLWLFGCSYAVGDGTDANSPSGRDHDARDTPVDDGARCEFRGREDREVAESVGTEALQPSIRRVYRVVGQGSERRRIIVCREVDTNLDGKKDVVRRYTDQGDPIEERADTNHDGVLDRSMRFARGKIAQVEIDQNQDDKPEETRYYQEGKLSRVQRDTNADGKPDVWEIYAAGHLERMGVDVDFDGRVDRWNRDEVTLRAQRAAEEAEPASSDDAPEESSGALPQQTATGAQAGAARAQPGASRPAQVPSAQPTPPSASPQEKPAAPPPSQPSQQPPEK